MGAVTVGYIVGWRELASYHELYYEVALLQSYIQSQFVLVMLYALLYW